jgi:D-sedoheptulose 7-phosphate isomerase
LDSNGKIREHNMNDSKSNLQSIRDEISASISTKSHLLEDQNILDQIHALSTKCIDSIKAGGKIIFAGNGGSFADAQHLSAEFTSRFMFDRAPLASLALGTNSSSMSAIGNDYGYEEVFSRELEGIGSDIDIFIPITTSGNSENIINCIKKAKELNIFTVCLTGKTGGKVSELSECIKIPSTNTARIQECHILIGHIICGNIENQIFKK